MQPNTTTKPATQPAQAKPAPVVPATVQPKPTAPAQYVALMVPANPKKPGSASAARFALYVQGGTVAAYRAAVVAAGQPARLAAADLLWDQRHGFITLHSTAAQAAQAAQPKPAQPAKA